MFSEVHMCLAKCEGICTTDRNTEQCWLRVLQQCIVQTRAARVANARGRYMTLTQSNKRMLR